MKRMLPYRPHTDATKSEHWVFNQLANDPSLNNHVILHSLGLARHQRKSYAECDFVVIGPFGVYCLEVKGGRVTRQSGVWTIGWPGKTYSTEEGPFKQAQSARGSLIQESRNRIGIKLTRRIPFGWGVVFPDVRFVENDPEWDQDCIFDERDRALPISAYLARLAEYTLTHESARGRVFQTPISHSDVRKLVDSFRPDFDLSPKISTLVKESHNELLSLSREQYTHLETILHPGNPRVLCEGAAGTGKTLLAAEAARRLAFQGYRVLFLCFNRNLTWHLRNQEFAKHQNVTMFTVWGLLYEMVVKIYPEQKSNADFNVILDLSEDAAIEATESGELQPYDVLILDEAQDVLNPGIMNALDWFLKDGVSGGRWVMFLDTDIQAIVYRSLENTAYDLLSSRAVNLKLTVNMRNPEAIAKEAALISRTDPPTCRRQLIAPVNYRTTRGNKSTYRISRQLISQLISEGANANEITLLSFRKPMEAFFKDGYHSIGKQVHVLDGGQREPSPDKILAASIPSFKGLESEIIIVGDLPDNDMTEWHTANLYVALTRARTAAYVICTQEHIKRRLKLLEEK